MLPGIEPLGCQPLIPHNIISLVNLQTALQLVKEFFLTTSAASVGMLNEILFNNETHIGNLGLFVTKCGHTRSQRAWTSLVSLNECLCRHAA